MVGTSAVVVTRQRSTAARNASGSKLGSKRIVAPIPRCTVAKPFARV